MKKLILILLTIISLVGFSSSASASSKKPTIDGVFHGMKRGFGFMVKTRDESLLNPETIQERRRVEGMIIRAYNNDNRRDILMRAYNEEVEGFRNTYNEHKKNGDGRERLSLECLGELNRLRSLMVSSSSK